LAVADKVMKLMTQENIDKLYEIVVNGKRVKQKKKEAS